MGNRVSIQFKNKNEKSVVLFSHRGGMDFVKETKNYIKQLKEKGEGKGIDPLGRLEPNTVMVDFIRHITKDETEVRSDYYLGATEKDGDNSDNGHHIISLD